MSEIRFAQWIRNQGIVRIPVKFRKQHGLKDGDYVWVTVEKVEK